MLQPDFIPSQEPVIRVGIILPEDDFTSVTILVPEQEAYQLSVDGRDFGLQEGSPLFFKLSKHTLQLQLKGELLSTETEFHLFPVRETKRLAPQQGCLVKNVISGRGFHWKKYIDVRLGGELIVRHRQNRLMLINQLPLEHYLMCVATSEMGAASPTALIEAQTIAARSWILANVEQKHLDLGIDVCNDDCCQRYQGTTFLSTQSVTGALNTFGQVLLYDQKICDARYSKSCGGVMESFATIWDNKPVPYLQVKADAESDPPEWKKPLSEEQHIKTWIDHVPNTFCSPHMIPEKDLKKYLGSVDEEGTYFRWVQEITQETLCNTLQTFHSLSVRYVNNLIVKKRGGSGRINHLTVLYTDENGIERSLELSSEFAVRQSLHPQFLYSSAFYVEIEKDEKDIPLRFILHGAGWGHGVGLCQIGALGMALHNYSTEAILTHYYPGSILKQIYSK